MNALYSIFSSLYRLTHIKMFDSIARSVTSAQRTKSEVDHLKRSVNDAKGKRKN